MPKFDVIIMNPPYSKNLHLQILEKVIPYANKTVNISPIGWLLDMPAVFEMKKTIFQKFENTVAKHIMYCHNLENDKANKAFEIFSFQHLGIIILDNNNYDVYKTIWMKNGKKLKSFFDKVILKVYKGEIDNIWNHIKISTIHGHPGSKDEFDIITPQYDIAIERKPNNMSELEFKNWHDSCNTYFMKYCNMLTRNGQHLYPNLLPYMNDYTKPWTNKRLCDYFGITGYIDDNTADPNSEWDIILNSFKNI